MKRITIVLISLVLINGIAFPQSCLPGENIFHNQNQIDYFKLSNPNCTEIEGSIHIFNDYITNLDSLNVLTSIWGDLTIEFANSLKNLSGLENIDSIGGKLKVGGAESRGAGNDSLISLDGLDSLTFVGGDLILISNKSLINLEALNNLSAIGGNFNIANNLSLTSLLGLGSLESISGNLVIGGFLCYFRDCAPWGNLSLKNLQGLNNLNSIGGDLILYANDSLTSLNGLNNLNSLYGDLRIGIIVESFSTYYFGNHLLSNITAIENIESNSIEGLQIVDNTFLSNCEISSICESLVNPNGEIWIENNAIGCNTLGEVEEACETVSIGEVSMFGDITLSPNPFSSTTNIEYHLKSTQTVTITFYNQFGKQVDRIEQKQSAGKQQVVWTPELPGGVYYFRLEARELFASGKVVLMR